MYKWLVGIDEVGRGPLAGPVAVGVVAVPIDFDWDEISGVDDSKVVKPAKRETIFEQAKKLRQAGKCHWQVSMVAASVIDKRGIVFAINQAMERSLNKLRLDPQVCYVKLDGSLEAPASYKYQETIIKGDGKEPAIGLASILAKVTRDRYMAELDKRKDLAPYGFAVHKGYGTKKHRQVIEKLGLSLVHRRSFCRGFSR